MFVYNQKVKDVNTGKVFRVVAPILHEEEEVAVWDDINCTKIRIIPTEYLESTEDALAPGTLHGRIVYDVVAVESGGLRVSREIDATGLDVVIAAYTDFRGFIKKVSSVPLTELDVLIDTAPSSLET